MSKAVQLSAKWQLDAALLSRPVDLTPLVSMSKSQPGEFLKDDTVHRMVTVLLNESNESKSDRETKLDVLTILANVALSDKEEAKEVVRSALQAVSEWFDSYLTAESDPESEPELHKMMTLLLARAWEYRLKTEDVLELTGGNRLLALETLVSLLEDGETYTTQLKQRRKAGQGQLACWEHELVCLRYEKPLILQMCRLIRGFTHPMTYFSSASAEMELHTVEQFSAEIDRLLDTTLRSKMIEKLSVALHDCIFQLSKDQPERLMSEHDHLAIVSVNAFLQNLYFYATQRNDEYRQHLLSDTLLIPRLVLPYLEQCVVHALILEKRGSDVAGPVAPDSSDGVVGLPLDAPAVVKGIAASLRTLVIATFRAPTTRFVMDLLRRFNPTLAILKAASLISTNGYLFSLLCVLNVNMGALAAQEPMDEVGESSLDSQEDTVHIHTLLHGLGEVYAAMDQRTKVEVARRVMFSTALPITRDTPSYMAIISVLHGGAAGQLDYVKGSSRAPRSDDEDEDVPQTDMRAAAKKEARDRLEQLRSSKDRARSDEQHSSFKHLADLPDLRKPKELVIDLELPTEVNRRRPMLADAKDVDGRAQKHSAEGDGVPREFKCAINGHVLKEPVRSPHGQVFERATIELWLVTRGSICPITNQPLTLADLQPADDLRAQIMRWHIQKTAYPATGSPSRADEDDLYDF